MSVMSPLWLLPNRILAFTSFLSSGHWKLALYRMPAFERVGFEELQLIVRAFHLDPDCFHGKFRRLEQDFYESPNNIRVCRHDSSFGFQPSRLFQWGLTMTGQSASSMRAFRIATLRSG